MNQKKLNNYVIVPEGVHTRLYPNWHVRNTRVSCLHLSEKFFSSLCSNIYLWFTHAAIDAIIYTE